MVFLNLLKAGADVNVGDSGGMTPLHYAAKYNVNPAVIPALLEAGAEVNARNNKKETPLDLAVRFRQYLARQALLEAGASPAAKDEEGKTR